MSEQNNIVLSRLKQALNSTHYFVVDKSNGESPCYLLYRRAEPKNVFVMKKTKLNDFVKETVKITGIDKEKLSADNTESSGKPSRQKEPRRYWWQDQD